MNDRCHLRTPEKNREGDVKAMKQRATVIDIDTIRRQRREKRFECPECLALVPFDGTKPVVCGVCLTTFEPLDEETIRELGGLDDEAE